MVTQRPKCHKVWVIALHREGSDFIGGNRHDYAMLRILAACPIDELDEDPDVGL